MRILALIADAGVEAGSRLLGGGSKVVRLYEIMT
jgi:hypothetical protein